MDERFQDVESPATSQLQLKDQTASGLITKSFQKVVAIGITNCGETQFRNNVSQQLKFS